MRWVPPGFGPFESYEPEHAVAGGERLSLAGLDIDVHLHPGPQPRARDLRDRPRRRTRRARCCCRATCCSPGSVGRVDLPGGDWPTLERSIGELLKRFPPETVVYPGHMGVTTLGRERDTNPFLSELRVGVPSARDGGLRSAARPGPEAERRQRPTLEPLTAPRSKRRGGPSTCWASRPAQRAALEARARAMLEGAGYERIETPVLEATELFARGRGRVHGHRQQGDVHAPGRRRALADAPP